MAPNINDCVENVRAAEPMQLEKRAKFDVNNNVGVAGKIETVAAVATTTTVAATDETNKPVKQAWVWRNILILGYIHLMWPYGWYLFAHASFGGRVFTLLMGLAGGFGITAGAHRLWAHKAYKANLALRIILMLFQTIAFQNHIYEWVRDHRVHHKYTDTDADPHNSKRGFWFSHVGWLLKRKHPDVKEKGKNIYMDDLKEDGVVMWQKKHYGWFMPALTFVGPAIFQHIVFGDPLWYCWNMTLTRWCTAVNITWLLNSAAHMWGWKPYDKSITPTDTAVLGFLCFGEGWHNYHHVFPWDYKTSELVNYGVNFTNGFIDFFAKIGWAYELKTVSMDMIKARVLRTGDGSHRLSGKLSDRQILDQFVDYVNAAHDQAEKLVWGWDDKDLSADEKTYVTIINKEE